MRTFLLMINLLSAIMVVSAIAREEFEMDSLKTSAGDLKITFIGHGSLMFNFGGKVIHVDPYSEVASYNTLAKAHLILLTHEHRDHLDPKALNAVRTEKTVVVLTEACAKQVEGEKSAKQDRAGEKFFSIEGMTAVIKDSISIF